MRLLVVEYVVVVGFCRLFFFQAEDGIRDLVRSRGLGDVYKRQADSSRNRNVLGSATARSPSRASSRSQARTVTAWPARACLLYTSDAADERSSVDLGGRRIIKKKKHDEAGGNARATDNTKEQ